MKPIVAYAGVALCAGCALQSTHVEQAVAMVPQPELPRQSCYALAMIGMDFVINARLGIFPDEVIHLARISPPPHSGDVYDQTMLNVMLEAYLWPDSPGSYATKVLEGCRNGVYG